jgi:hypothetical protein
VAEYISSKCKALTSNLTTATKNNNSNNNISRFKSSREHIEGKEEMYENQ